MPEDMSKLLGLIEELAIIGEDVADNKAIYGVTIDTGREHPVHVHLKSLESLKKHYPDKVASGPFDKTFNREYMIFFDTVRVFCLTAKAELVEAAV